MDMENLKKMKECLIGVAEGQVYGNLDKVNAEELGEVMDMIKDLSEAVYYCTITESMEKQAKEEEKYGSHPMYYNPYQTEMYPRYGERYYPGTMYAQNYSTNGSSSDGGSGNTGRSSGGNNARGGGTRGYRDGMIRRYDDGQTSYTMYNDGTMYHEPMGYVYRDGMMQEPHYPMMRDPKEGRSGERRKMYMEGKGYKDKTSQMKELESYMQELSQDMTEMIQDASPEEKQMLQQKIQVLATKIK